MATSTQPVIPGTQGWAKTQIPAYNALIAKKQDQRNIDKQFQNQAADDVANQNSALAATRASIDAGLDKKAEMDLKSAYLANPPQLSAATDSFGTQVGKQLQGVGKGAVLTAAAPIHALAGAADFVRDSANASANGMKPGAIQPANTLNDIKGALNSTAPVVKQLATSFGDKLKAAAPIEAVAAPVTPPAVAPTNVKPVAKQPVVLPTQAESLAEAAKGNEAIRSDYAGGTTAPIRSTSTIDANGVKTMSGTGYSISSANQGGVFNPSRNGALSTTGKPYRSTPESLSALDKTIAYNARPETKEMFAREAAIVDKRLADAKARRQGNQQQDLENLALNGGANGGMSFSQAQAANRQQKAAAGILALRNDATQNSQRNAIAERGLDITDRNTQATMEQNALEREDQKSWREQAAKREDEKLNRPKIMEIEEPVPGSTLGETRKRIAAFNPSTGQEVKQAPSAAIAEYRKDPSPEAKQEFLSLFGYLPE